MSDEESRGEARAGSSSGKKERFFWQYNVQAKGPKGHRISLAPETVDPHVLNKVQDPVFSPYCSVDGIKHRYLQLVTFKILLRSLRFDTYCMN